jgi:NADH:ubiquinone oxidoreductase subunit E
MVIGCVGACHHSPNIDIDKIKAQMFLLHGSVNIEMD